MENVKNWLQLIRIKHWVKNFIIFIPMFFFKKINGLLVVQSMFAFIAFCAVASSIYIFNDIQDIELDKKHLEKKNRPIASGRISVKRAMFMHYFAFGIGFVFLICASSKNFILSLLLYVVYYMINVLYSIKGKHVPLLDIVILASGFLIRLFFGASVTGILVSQWLWLVIMSGSFYLGLCKRRNEFVNQKEGRKVLKYYNYNFLDKNMYLCLGLTIVFYALWCTDYGTKSYYLLSTLPIVLIISMRYNLNVENENSTGDPTDVILNDKLLLMLIAILIIMLFVIIYLI